ncbi:leucyl/phenylalanyl-tRNA--protein transferase [Endothiovibrio diazotrophicus]
MIPWLDPTRPTQPFPPLSSALAEPDGLLAAGGDLSPQRLLRAYRSGIFPWSEEGQPLLWWSPDPRAVLRPETLKVSRSLRKRLNRGEYRVTFDTDFAAVMRACAEPREGQQGTWITGQMVTAYCRLHEEGVAHSVECRFQEELVGGLYGVALGRVFFGESMFSRRSDASKVALVHLAHKLLAWDYRLIDCQLSSSHLRSLGAEEIPRQEFAALLDRWCDVGGRGGKWDHAE